MEDVVILEWVFSPTDLFEEPIHITENGYSITIEKGRIESRIKPTVYDKRPNLRAELHDLLEYRFLSEEMFTQRPYKLSTSSVARLHADGRRDATAFLEGVVLTFSVGMKVDVVVRDREGRVVSDSRGERIQKKNEIAALVEAHRGDPLLDSLLRSFHTAVNDPANEIAHLFEIRDALSKRFRGKDEARRKLATSEKAWSTFGRLANVEPLRQGRHRGKSAGHLRDATEAELEEARSFARGLIERYARYLEGKAPSKS